MPNFAGKAIDGPASGQIIESPSKTVMVPVRVGPDRGEGDRGFAPIIYRYSDDGTWTCRVQ